MYKTSGVSSVVREDIKRIASADLPWRELDGARVLVTGATGMIPSYTVLALLEVAEKYDLDLEVIALARNKARAELLYGSLLQSSRLRLQIQDVIEPIGGITKLTHVIHGASAAQPSRHAADPVGTLTANISGTHNLLEAARSLGASSFTLMSSAEVYGNTANAGAMITESDYGGIDLLNPRSCYSEGKRASETFAAVYNQQYGIPYVAARFGHIYGPGIALDDGRVQADFARDVFEGRDITLKSAGTAQRTYTYIGDAVAGMFTAMLLGDSGAYNISDSTGLVSIRDLAQCFLEARPEKQLSLRFEEEADAFATNKVAFQGLDSSKLASLGWEPSIPLRVGVDRYLRHLEETV